jgi:hypothetical protein
VGYDATGRGATNPGVEGARGLARAVSLADDSGDHSGGTPGGVVGESGAVASGYLRGAGGGSTLPVAQLGGDLVKVDALGTGDCGFGGPSKGIPSKDHMEREGVRCGDIECLELA